MKNMGIALLVVAGVMLLGIIVRFPYEVWLVIDIGVIITCSVIGFAILKK